MIPFRRDTQNRQIHREIKQNIGYQGLRAGWELLFIDRVIVWDDEKLLEMDGASVCTTL